MLLSAYGIRYSIFAVSYYQSRLTKEVGKMAKKELMKLLKEYEERFNEGFPTFHFMGDDDGMAKEIKKSLKTGKPYDPEPKDDILY